LGVLIDTVLLTPLDIIPVKAGNVMHVMRHDSAGFNGFGEVYLSWLEPGATKGWKRHRDMTLNLVVPIGLVAFAVVDAKEGIGRRYELGPTAYGRLTIPPGLWVAFRSRASEPSAILNVADIEHDPAEADRAPEASFSFDWNALIWPSSSGQQVAPL
jgi:dTDP-4-dehydrorhamnose 3,5-epimerase